MKDKSLSVSLFVAALYILASTTIFFIYMRSPLGLAGALGVALVVKKLACRVDRRLLPSKSTFAAALTLAVALTFITGGMAWVYGVEQGDWRKHNRMLKDLIDYRWPVFYESGESLNYYLAFYLPAAVVGKVAGFETAKIFISLWIIAGLTVSFINLSDYMGLNRRRLWQILLMLLLFSFYSGWDWLCHIVVDGSVPAYPIHLEWGTHVSQYSSFMSALTYVPHHTLASMIVLPFMLTSGTGFLFMLCAAAIWSPFATVGLTFIYGVSLAVGYFRNKSANINVMDILYAVAVGTPVFLFYLLHHHVDFTPYILMTPVKYATFVATEVGVFALALALLWRRIEWEKTLVMAAIIALLAIPVFRYGRTGYNDFVMRASIPLIMFTVAVILKYLTVTKNAFIVAAVVLLMTLGFLTPLHEVGRVMWGQYVRYPRMRNYEIPEVSWKRNQYLGGAGFNNTVLDLLYRPVV